MNAIMLKLAADTASCLAHRVCCNEEHDPTNGKLSGFCVVCGVVWPCPTAEYFLRKPVETLTP